MGSVARVRTEGHLIDSGQLQRIMDQVIRSGARFEFLDFQIGRTNDDASSALMEITAPSAESMEELLQRLLPLGAVQSEAGKLVLLPAPAAGVVPEDFYSTTNHATQVRWNGRWISVADQRMDSVIVLENGEARCTKLRDVKQGQQIVTGWRSSNSGRAN